jgi:DNA-binding MarR family transcriptional regulator
VTASKWLRTVARSTIGAYPRAVQPACDRRHHAWPLFLRTYAVLVEALDGEMQAHAGLPLTWFDVLVHLEGAPEGRLRMNDLAAHVLLSKSGLSRLVDRMEAAGLVARGACSADRRVVFAVITPGGRAAFARAAPVAVRGVHEHFSRHLTPTEERALTSALTKILRAARAPRARAG